MEGKGFRRCKWLVWIRWDPRDPMAEVGFLSECWTEWLSSLSRSLSKEWGFYDTQSRCAPSCDLEFTPAYLVQCSPIHCVWRKHFFLWHTEQRDSYILSDVLVCSIAKYFYELYRILTCLAGSSKYKQTTQPHLHFLEGGKSEAD